MKILLHFLKGFGSPITAIEWVGYTKIYTSRGFELDKKNLAKDILNIRQDADYSVEHLNKTYKEVLTYGGDREEYGE